MLFKMLAQMSLRVPSSIRQMSTATAPAQASRGRKPPRQRLNAAKPVSAAKLSSPTPQTPTFRPPIYRPAPSAYVRMARPPLPQRHITDVETALPLPTTYPTGHNSVPPRPRIPSEKLDISTHPYPYKYYEISLVRSQLGLPKATRHILQSMGLHKRHQVVWRAVGPRSAGQILKVRELVKVRLVNEIPQKMEIPTGFRKIANAITEARV